LILCYTDSLVECVCRDGSLLGSRRLLEIVQSIPLNEPSPILHHLVAKLAAYGATINDDVTMLLARCSGPSFGVGFGRRLSAQFKFIAQVLTLRRNLPWPEVSWRNIAGAVLPAANRRKRV
jgi:hypothetical protein